MSFQTSLRPGIGKNGDINLIKPYQRMVYSENRQAAVGVEPTNNGFANRRHESLNPCKDCTCNHTKKSNTEKYTDLPGILPELKELVNSWNDLPENVRRAIMALAGIELEKRTKLE